MASARELAHASSSKGKVVTSPIGPYWKAHIDLVGHLQGFDVYKPMARDIISWHIDNEVKYFYYANPMGPANKGVSCSTLIFKAYRGAGAFVKYRPSYEMLAGKGGWNNVHVSLSQGEPLDLLGGKMGKKRISHVMVLWN